MKQYKNITKLLFLIINTSFIWSKVEKKKKTINSLALTPESLIQLHYEGYCVKACNFASERSENDAERPLKILNSNFRYKSMAEFLGVLTRYETLRDEIEGEGLLTVDDIDTYCKENDLTLEVCVQTVRESLIYEQAEQCFNRCTEKVHTRDPPPQFEDSAPLFQDLETCAKDIQPYTFDMKNLEITKAADIYKRQGFVVIENVFPETFMSELKNILNAWRKLGTWNDYKFTDFVYEEHTPTANRYEVMLPYEKPFTHLMHRTNNMFKDLIKVIRGKACGDKKPLLKSFSALASVPGSVKGSYETPKIAYPNMMTASIILQDLQEYQGERIYCPCTVQNSHLFSFFSNEGSCPIQYNTEGIKAGSVVLFDPLLKFFELENAGDFVSWKIDATWVIDENMMEVEDPLKYLHGDELDNEEKLKNVMKHLKEYIKSFEK